MKPTIFLLLATFVSCAFADDSEFYPQDERSPAENPVRLYVFPDDGKLSGWVAGTEQPATNKLTINGEETALDGENRFEWSGEAGQVTIAIGDEKRVVSIPKPSEYKPIAFFVVDRSAYRPASKLQFTAFVRTPGEKGSFEPFANQEIEAVLTSVSKGIHATTLDLKTDALGRVIGEYQFSAADPIDEYKLKIKGVIGEAKVKLAEFRKSKVRIDISHEQTDPNTLKLRFRALDFLEKNVEASNLRFEAQVVRDPSPAQDLWGLDPAEFAYGGTNPLTAEERALRKAGYRIAHTGGQPEPVHLMSEELAMGENGEAEFYFTIDPGWKHGHTLQIQASIIDGNQREQKASKRIPLGAPEDPELQLTFDRTEVRENQPLNIAVNAPEGRSLSLLSFRLDMRTPHSRITPAGTIRYNPRSLDHLRGRASRAVTLHQQQLQMPSPTIVRQFQTVTPLKPVADDPNQFESKLRFVKAGAYVVRVLAQDEDGNETQAERIVIVTPKDRDNGLFLELDSDRIDAGQPLKGRIHSRFDGARVLLALQDSRGVQLLEPISVEGGFEDFEIELPDNLSLGCELTARYSDDGDLLHLHRRSLAIEPSAKPLAITTKVPEVVEPGTEVTIELNVDRQEETDLVVSVYDKSLLGIAPDSGVDGRSLFFADVRVDESAVKRMFEGYLGGLTLNQVDERIEAWIDATPSDHFMWRYLRDVHSNIHGRQFNLQNLFALLIQHGADVDTVHEDRYYYWQLRDLKDEDMNRPIVDLIGRPSHNGHYHLMPGLAGDVILCDIGVLSNGEIVPYQTSNGAFFGRDASLLGSGLSITSGGRVDIRGRARGDAMFSAGELSVSGNAMLPSGQALYSHLATGGIAAAAAPFVAQVAAVDEPMTIRRDFSDSAFFNANVRTGDDGRASVKFKLPDSLTNWQVVVTGVTQDLSIGRQTASFRTHKPVMVWPMLSQGFTSGDRAQIFALVHNHTAQKQKFVVKTTVKNGELHGPGEREIEIGANGSAPVYFEYEAGDPGFTEILMSASCDGGDDASLKRLPVFPCMAEKVATRAGFAKGAVNLEIPDDADLEQSKLEITLSPTLAGDMFDSLGYLIAYPHGCVEQTMSRYLPTIKVAQVLRNFEIEDEELERLSQEYSKAGIKRLLELQQPDGGWGWQSNSRTHEMMTPYALYGLIEAERAGFEIPNDEAIPRGMDRLAGFINSMGDNQSADRIYCMWVYQHHDELPKDWWGWLENISSRTLSVSRRRDDLLSDYAAAMALEMAVKSERRALASKMAQLLEFRAQGTDSQAYWTTARFSRWGNDRFEITAAVLKAFAAYDPEHVLVPRVLNFFASTKRGNRWNSTKDTAMIVYALCDYLNTREVQLGDETHETIVVVNGVEHKLVNEGWRPKTFELGIAAQENEIEFVESDPTHLYRFVCRHWQNGREIEPANVGIEVTRRFDLMDADGNRIRALKSGDDVVRGSLIRSYLHITRPANSPFALAANPKPSCAEFTERGTVNDGQTHNVFREQKISGVFSHYETPHGAIHDSVTYRVELAGEYLVAPAYAELLYDTAVRGHSGSFVLNVVEPENLQANAD
ncbi:MAG: alpha-2-macroglobulin family protein [Verrucomicrobiota bacterium]